MIEPHGYFRIICAVFITFPVYCATRLVSIVLPQDEADDHIYTMNFYIGPIKQIITYSVLREKVRGMFYLVFTLI